MKQYLPIVLPVAAAVALIVAASIVQGVLTDRWTPHTSDELKAFAAALEKVPEHVGADWDAESTSEMDPREREAAGAVGALSRKYRNFRTQDVVSVYAICGASRNVAIHTPDACYPGSGFRMEDDIQPFTIHYGDDSAEFRTAVFLKEDPAGTQRLRVLWAWNATGKWEVPEWPRMKYGGRTPLNKIYLIAPVRAGEEDKDSAAVAFGKQFLPVITPLLFPGQSAGPSAEPSESAPGMQPSPGPEDQGKSQEPSSPGASGGNATATSGSGPAG